MYSDRVTVGGVSSAHQLVESATALSGAFTSDAYSSGLLGLGMGRGNTVRPGPQPTWFDAVRDGLAAPLFAADLRHGAPGTYDFGFVDHAKYTGAVMYTPVRPGGYYWEMTAAGYQVGTDAPFAPLAFDVIADTGTTLLLLPDAIVKAYYGQVPGSYFDEDDWGAVLFPCGADLPDFYFGLANGYRGRVPGRYINYGTTDGRNCYGGLQSSTGIGLNIMGAVLLKAQFVVFDYRNSGQLGFANKVLKT